MNKKAWLDKLYYDIGKQQCNFKISGLKRLEDGSSQSTRWHNYLDKIAILDLDEDWKIEWVNQRQILPNELVIDLEERETLNRVILKLKYYKQKYYIYDTGSRGYHIHIFYKNPLTEKQKRKYIKRFGGDEQLSSLKHMVNLEYS
jgi:hypothetical protein